MRTKTCIMLLLLICFSAGCIDKVKESDPDKIKVQLKYTHQAQFAGLYVALDKGYYQDENLAVKMIEGGGDVDLIAPVMNGDAQFGIAASDLILESRTKNIPVKAIAAIYRRSAAVFVAHADSGIERPHDFKGKKIAVRSKSTREFEFQLKAMLKKLKLDISQMELLELDYQYTGFTAGDIDVTAAYISGGVRRLLAQNVKLNIIWPSDYGINFYSDTIFAKESLLKSNPDLVLRFLRATLKGWKYAIINQEDAVDITMRYAKIKDRELQEEIMKAQHPLIYTGEDSIGWMSESVWSGMNKIMFEQGVILTPVDDISSVYTMQFLESIYGTKSTGVRQ